MLANHSVIAVLLLALPSQFIFTDAYESLDYSTLTTFKAGWNDMLWMNQKTSLNLK
jgi:hypothetical protein